MPLAGFFASLGRDWNHVLARFEQPDGRCPTSLGSVNKCWQGQTVNAVAGGLRILACVPSEPDDHARHFFKHYVLFRCSSVALTDASYCRQTCKGKATEQSVVKGTVGWVYS